MTDYSALLAALRDLQRETRLDANHCYWRAKRRVPGVTSIIKTLDAPFLDNWKIKVQVEGTARVAHANPPIWGEEVESYVSRLLSAHGDYEHKRLSEAAADVGHQVHALIEHAVKCRLGEPYAAPEATDEALFIFAGWKEWAEDVGLEPLMAEGRIYHPLGYCGTFDLLAMAQGKPAVFDWKPQLRLYPERRLQSAAYREALHAMGWPPLEGYIVALPRAGGDISMTALESGEALAETFKAFEACLYLYRWLKSTQKEERKAVAAA